MSGVSSCSTFLDSYRSQRVSHRLRSSPPTPARALQGWNIVPPERTLCEANPRSSKVVQLLLCLFGWTLTSSRIGLGTAGVLVHDLDERRGEPEQPSRPYPRGARDRVPVSKTRQHRRPHRPPAARWPAPHPRPAPRAAKKQRGRRSQEVEVRGVPVTPLPQRPGTGHRGPRGSARQFESPRPALRPPHRPSWRPGFRPQSGHRVPVIRQPPHAHSVAGTSGSTRETSGDSAWSSSMNRACPEKPGPNPRTKGPGRHIRSPADLSDSALWFAAMMLIANVFDATHEQTHDLQDKLMPTSHQLERPKMSTERPRSHSWSPPRGFRTCR